MISCTDAGNEIYTGLQLTAKKYGEKQSEGKSPEKLMFALAWDVQELERLDKAGRKLVVDCECLTSKLLSSEHNIRQDNLPKQLCCVKDNMVNYANSVVKYRRTAATHVLVVMISPEARNKKPYAVPVQCIPYSSLTDEEVRLLCDKLIKEMTSRGMRVAGKHHKNITIIIANNIILFEIHAGCSTDGEWNSIRSKGRKRPISIFEIRSRVRRTYQRLGITKLRGMITPIGEHMHATCICIDCYDHV